MNTSSLVSILMPAYNAEKFVAQAINSILTQDYSNWELLILDDASTDGTDEVIASFNDSRIHIFHHSENRGYLLSCNELFKKATGGFITFLDADDSCSASRLSICLNAFEKDANLEFLTTAHSKITDSGKTISNQFIEIDYKKYATDPNYCPTICCATTFVKKELLDGVGGYRPLFKKIGAEDYFWLWELSRNGKGKHLNKSLYDYRSHTNQTSNVHDDELYLFTPELIKTLRFEFRDLPWNDNKAENFVQSIREQFEFSGFQINLRKAQNSLNRGHGHFWNYALKCLRNIRDFNQIKPYFYLLYSWLIRKGRSANQ